MKKNRIFFLCAALAFCMAGFAQAPKQIQAQVVFKAKASTGEGSIWNSQRNSLFWVDIEGKTLHEFLPEKKTCRHWSFDRMITTVVPETPNTVVVALQNEVTRVNLDNGSTETISPIFDDNGKLRTNDGKCDPEGRLWVGTMGFGAPHGQASLYCVLSDGSQTTKLIGVTISNGLVWTKDKKYMYYNDTPTGKIARYRYDAESGDITWDGIAVQMKPGEGSPDGMTIDNEDHLWVAQWGGFGVYCYDPMTGQQLAKVNVPAPNVASCAFGGANLDELYITTARSSLKPEQLKKYPLSGSLFICRPGAKGVDANRFGADH